MFKKFLFGAMLMTAVTASAQESSLAGKSDSKSGDDRAEMLSTAGKLVKYGYQTESALPLIQALQIYQQFNLQPGEGTPEVEANGMTSNDNQQKTNKVSYDKDKLVADATTFSEGNKNLLALLKDVSGATRGATYGAIRRTGRIPANSTQTWTFSFRAGQTATVLVSGDGDTDLDLYIYDMNGNLICSDIDYTDDCLVSFLPYYTTNFKIVIKNRGRVYNDYVLITN